MQLDPLLAKLYDIFRDLNFTDKDEDSQALEMTLNPLKHHVSSDLMPIAMYN